MYLYKKTEKKQTNVLTVPVSGKWDYGSIIISYTFISHILTFILNSRLISNCPLNTYVNVW